MQYRTMTADDLAHALDWAAREGWNPGLEDAPAFLSADPNGFFMAEVDGEPVAAISVVNHTEAFAFLGLYLCIPSYRGKGIGYGLWQHAMKHAGDRTVGLDGVPDQQANYVKSGFEWAGETTRYTGVLPAGSAPEFDVAVDADVDQIVALEARHSGISKQEYLRAWCRETQTRRTFVLRKDGKIEGACTLRACREGYKIGPLIAPTEDDAKRLMAAAYSISGTQPVSVDVPQSSDGLANLCQSFGMEPGFSTARMYRGPAPKGAGQFFAVVSLELG